MSITTYPSDTVSLELYGIRVINQSELSIAINLLSNLHKSFGNTYHQYTYLVQRYICKLRYNV